MRPLKGGRGSAIIQVLVTGVIMAFIASGLITIVLMQYRATSRANEGNMAKRAAEGTLHRILANWNSAGPCTDIATAPSVTCAPNGSCPCVCTVASGGATVMTLTATSVGGACRLSIDAPMTATP